MKNWKKNLANFFEKQKGSKREKEVKHSQEKLRIEKFYSTIVNPAFEELKSELKRHGRDVEVYTERRDFASIIVNFEGEEELDYSIEVMISPVHVFPRPVIHYTEWASSRRLRVEGLLRKGRQNYDISDISKEEIIEHFLNEYRNYIEFEY
ncbi:MAG: hypothetical protein OEY25_10305 [Candidatus Aminicenantes bacterium]|nr:hypothetical protein [Candidatus Aminicenantes bacterium]MDH5706387.1 hypothetical protein [Candidatus Aminicenantes bacterium]